MRFLILFLLLVAPLSACPFCAPSSSDLYTIVDNSQAVAKVEKVGEGKYKITEVLKGKAKVGRVVLAGASRAFSSTQPEALLLSTISNPNQPYWSEPVRPLTNREYGFVKSSLSAPSKAKLLDLAARHLEDKSDLLADSAYSILAPAEVEEVQARAGLVGQKKLISWIQAPTVLSERKSLYLLMALPKLTSQDKSWLKTQLLNPPLSAYASHLAPMMVAYARTGGATALKEMEAVFLKPGASASATFGATSGFTYIGTYETDPAIKSAARDIIRRELDHPDRGVFAISTLAEWRDFGVADKIEAMAYKHEETPWVVSSATRYFRSFESQKAREGIKRLAAKYPKIVESAQKPFPKAK